MRAIFGNECSFFIHCLITVVLNLLFNNELDL